MSHNEPCKNCGYIYGESDAEAYESLRNAVLHPVFEKLWENELKSCYDIDPSLTPHDNIGFWKGYEFAKSIIEKAVKDQSGIHN